MKLPAISIRSKIMFFLTLIPVVSGLIFLLLAIDIFKKDKIAYIFESSLAVSKAKAATVRITLGDLEI